MKDKSLILETPSPFPPSSLSWRRWVGLRNAAQNRLFYFIMFSISVTKWNKKCLKKIFFLHRKSFVIEMNVRFVEEISWEFMFEKAIKKKFLPLYLRCICASVLSPATEQMFHWQQKHYEIILKSTNFLKKKK